jgi:hypothetical protein
MNKEFKKMQKIAGLIKENFKGKLEELYDEDLAYRIADIIENEVYLKRGTQELDPDSVKEAARKIAQMLNS